MKKLLLLMPALLAPIQFAVSCVREETQEEKDEKLAKKYEKDIDKGKYVFDDFEQFEMKDEYFEEQLEIDELWTKPDRNIKKYWLTGLFFNDFDKWYNDFQHKFNIFKKVMNKYASKEIIEYKNPNINADPIHLYYVKEVKFDFSRGIPSQSYYMQLFNGGFERIVRLFNIPNLNLNLSVKSPIWDLFNSFNIKTYYSKINITAVYEYVYSDTIEKMRDIFSVPKPYYKNEHFMTYPAGEEQYQGKGDWKPKVTFESFRGLEKSYSNNKFLNLRYKKSFDYGPSDIDREYLENYGNYNPLKFASYRFEIIEYDPDRPDAEPSKIDEFVLSKHGI
ncbi:hypothetical protein PT313_01020 [Metamycoplasma hyosynoviae]|uniref:hypothetical protein n=2 Tax=Metamycoplasma hyosynoviae TaxID=29559 RepID=UPI002362275F|nr:hypothetical protein [Metamycoplasma hyosynoviae]MDD1372206.1 hypothetical protein [Metamycoplasma hyosynoviae]MDD1373376.1 hypothetical protein [Metamycoplasma hyosynoviae]MDD1374181.1 hypothetical protein [Metamycoplasma hyosynoviae]MDD1375469.1 hypothetical protein [Metamycoplasma hyosynoviae]MDD1376761.1 hypothetical protein [Metamycoplasma hyosynoviae]